MSEATSDCFVVEGKLALPYQYFAGRTGSRFLVALRDEKRIRGVRCGRCRRIFLPPRSNCERCFSDLSDSWVQVENTGIVTGFTVIRYAEPHQPIAPPFVLALIRLSGADTPLVHIVKGIPFDRMKVGLKVEAVFAETNTSTLMEIDHFRPCA